MSVHSLDECFVNTLLIWTELAISSDGFGPFLIKGVIAIDGVVVFA